MTTAHDDNQLGRARVSDTPELTAYYGELAERDAGALWTVANDIEPWYPRPRSVPVLWRYEELRPLVRKALDLVKADDAGRRVVMLVNPGRGTSAPQSAFSTRACRSWAPARR
jgi:gentisate 1,2-dioxygenase